MTTDTLHYVEGSWLGHALRHVLSTVLVVLGLAVIACGAVAARFVLYAISMIRS
jgi:hypothetical protein